jgi:hypothetical protein
MAVRYHSKWLAYPPRRSSLSSASTISLMRRRLPVAPMGTHGTVTQVRQRWRDFNSDMKSQTAKTWCSMNVTIAQ